MKKVSWHIEYPGVAELRPLTRPELALLAPLLRDVEDGWRLHLEGHMCPPGAGLTEGDYAAQYTPWSQAPGPNTRAWAETWIALRQRNDRVLVLHAIVVIDEERATELAEWYELPLSVYASPERLRQRSYEELRAATWVDVLERMQWIHHTYHLDEDTADELPAPRTVLRSQNPAAVDRLEAVLRTAHPMLRRRAQLLDEYCGEIELERVRDLDGDCRLLHTSVRMRLCARGEYRGEEHLVLIEWSSHFDQGISDHIETPALVVMLVDAMLANPALPYALVEGSRLANCSIDPRQAIAQFPTSPVLQAMCRHTSPTSVFEALTWGRLVEPSPMRLM